jgi:hypothetical protein
MQTMKRFRCVAVVGTAVLVAASLLIATGPGASGGVVGCPEDVPTPQLEVGGRAAELTLGVIRICVDGEPPGSLHGDGPAVFGKIAVVELTGDLVVRVDPEWNAEVHWTGGRADQAQPGLWSLEPPARDGCYRGSVKLEQGSAGADWQALVRTALYEGACGTS